MNRSIVIVVASCSVLVSCGGSSSSNLANPNTINGEANGELVYNACESSYYKEIIGTYRGDVEYSYTHTDNELKRSCVFEVEFKISGTPIVGPASDSAPGAATLTATSCDLKASFTGTVEQIIFRPTDDQFVYECVINQGALFINDPNSSVVDPEIFYENIVYPVSMSLSGDISQPSDGPYNSNADVNVPYINFIGSSSPLITSVVFQGSGVALFVSSTDGEFGRKVDSSLAKEDEQ